MYIICFELILNLLWQNAKCNRAYTTVCFDYFMKTFQFPNNYEHFILYVTNYKKNAIKSKIKLTIENSNILSLFYEDLQKHF